jgi:Domain of unknown function (DUF397)
MNHQLPPAPSQDELARARWTKATKSNSAQGCVEVAHLRDWTAVRDSKRPDGPIQLYTPFEWECFLDGMSKGEFNRA